uniref:Uncharacterized protein n=1 Tax=Parascaris univalens TaxID=6257 RepID=A0A915C4H6_PARUN
LVLPLVKMGSSERFTEQATDERVVYIVHPNMAVTRERKRHGKSVESRYAGEYVYMSSEGQTVFVNYVPTQYYEEDAKLQPHRADTPIADQIDDGYLKRRWNELAAKLVELSNHPQPMNSLKT